MLETLTKKNQEWAKQAAVLITVIAKTTFERDGATNHHAQYDTGGAVANLTLQAVSLGLQVHQMAGFDNTKLRSSFDVPSEFEPLTVLAIGYADETALVQKQRSRKELQEFVFESRWANPARLMKS